MTCASGSLWVSSAKTARSTARPSCAAGTRCPDRPCVERSSCSATRAWSRRGTARAGSSPAARSTSGWRWGRSATPRRRSPRRASRSTGAWWSSATGGGLRAGRKPPGAGGQRVAACAVRPQRRRRRARRRAGVGAGRVRERDQPCRCHGSRHLGDARAAGPANRQRAPDDHRRRRNRRRRCPARRGPGHTVAPGPPPCDPRRPAAARACPTTATSRTASRSRWSSTAGQVPRAAEPPGLRSLSSATDPTTRFSEEHTP